MLYLKPTQDEEEFGLSALTQGLYKGQFGRTRFIDEIQK